jgi:hypothetical protein
LKDSWCWVPQVLNSAGWLPAPAWSCVTFWFTLATCVEHWTLFYPW